MHTSQVQGVPQSQTAALPRPQEEEETDKSKQAQTEQTYEKHYNKSPRRINHKATKSKTNTGTTALVLS